MKKQNHVGIGTFSDIVFKNGFAYYQDKKIDVLRFSVSPGRLNVEQIKKLKSVKLKYINTPDLAAMGDKSLLEGIENEMIMKTSKLDESSRDYVINNKDKYVIKPTNKDEGNGVYIGIDLPQVKREDLVNQNIGKQYLVQEYIQVCPKKTKMYQDGTTIDLDTYYDFCPHIFYKYGKMIGVGHVLIRYSANKIVNVLKGGGIGYYRYK